MKLCLIALLILGLSSCAAPPATGVTFTVDIYDPDQVATGYHDDLERCLLAATDEWGQYLDSTANIELDVYFLKMPYHLMVAGAAESVFYGLQHDGTVIWEWNTAHELRTGVDVNGSDPDGWIFVDPDNLPDFHLDPDSDDIFLGQYDAYSVFVHELGHVFVFSGWLEDDPAAERPPYLSVYDMFVEPTEDSWVFTGPRALEINPDGIPINSKSNVHLRDPDSVMARYVKRGTRLSLTPVELAIVADCDVPLISEDEEPPVVTLPEPCCGPGPAALLFTAALLPFVGTYARSFLK
jgi:hypothetical protein